jgi:adenylyltransferase/sulfurtransferase
MEFITAVELQKKLENGDSFILLDVREPFEANISNFKEETTSIPFHKLGSGVEDLDKDEEYIVYCRSGATSKDACEILEKAGFKNIKSLKGGINDWAKKIDSALPQY